MDMSISTIQWGYRAMRLVFIILSIISLTGCATLGNTQKLQSQVDALETRLRQQQQIIIEQENVISQRTVDMRKLQLLVQDKDKLLREKEERILKLRKRLEGFGVFE